MPKSVTNIKKQITISSTTENLSKIRSFIKKISLDVGFDVETANKIVLAADEACTNIIKHAYKYSKKGKIIVNVSFSNKKLKIIITDKGLPFNAQSIPEPDLKKYYKEKRIGGLGMFLMKKLMDEVIYSHSNDKKNKVILTKYLP